MKWLSIALGTLLFATALLCWWESREIKSLTAKTAAQEMEIQTKDKALEEMKKDRETINQALTRNRETEERIESLREDIRKADRNAKKRDEVFKKWAESRVPDYVVRSLGGVRHDNQDKSDSSSRKANP